MAAKVIVGLSGGVDSAVAALLLKNEGYEVIGLTLRTWESEGGESRCCEIDDARETARKLGIRYLVFNRVSDFKDKIVGPFIESYLRGVTPNPCVICNREIKWEQLCYAARLTGSDYVATGHYAELIKLPNGRYTVKKALHAENDQSYMLYRLTQDQLAMTLLPLGGYSKAEIREIAETAGLEVAHKRDSQEICFVTDGNYADFIAEHAGRALPGEGNFVDTEGRILGKHRGIVHYTVGPRRGLGIALGQRAYIRKICPETNEIVLGFSDDTVCREIVCGDLNFLGICEPESGTAMRSSVKVRYRHPGAPANLYFGEGECRIIFDEPVGFAAPGQSAVFYDDDGRVIGGGIIKEAVFD